MITSAKTKPNSTTKRIKAKLIKTATYCPRADFLPVDHATHLQYLLYVMHAIHLSALEPNVTNIYQVHPLCTC